MSDALRAVAVEAAARFREYERLHLAKGTAEGNEKAASNAAMAAKIEAALGEVSPPVAEMVADDLAMLEVLKGQAPAGIDPLDLFRAADLMSREFGPTAQQLQGLVNGGWARVGVGPDWGKVYATDATIAHPGIAARPWPAVGA
jgi:hypothetical protein